MADDVNASNPQTPVNLVPPVSDTPDGPDQPEPGIALCRSGGGYRAMLFHLGSLWRLNELHYLFEANRVSGVSGGPITAGILARNWSKLGFDADDFALDFDQQITRRLRGVASVTIDVPSVFQRFLVGASEALAKHYRKFLFDETTLQDLPDEPRFVFNATSLKTGVLWRFSKPYRGTIRLDSSTTPRCYWPRRRLLPLPSHQFFPQQLSS